VAPQSEERRYLRGVARRLRALSVPTHWQVAADGRPTAEAIAGYAGLCGADVIAMAGRGRGPLSRLFRGSVAEEVACRASVPVLLTRHRDPAATPRPRPGTD
jgi:nucleotide-binding universal stress UspA family protein